MAAYGDFSKGKDEFVINTADIPRNWYNYLWNDNYITFVSQTGAGNGFLQDGLGRRITPVDERTLFITENEKHWGISGLPVEEKRDAYFCTHGLGYSVIHTENNLITSDLTFFVPDKDNCEIWILKVKNNSDKARNLKIYGYSGTQVDWAYSRQGYNLSTAKYFDGINGLIGSNMCDFENDKNKTFYCFMALSEKPDNYNATVNGFIGVYGSLAYPKAIVNNCLETSECNGEKIGFCLQKDVFLKENEETTLIFTVGVAFSEKEAEEISLKFRDKEAVLNALNEVKEKFKRQTDGVMINTPDEKLNQMFSWLKHQANLGSRWARVRHNGFRDLTSDCDCLAAFNSSLALKRFKRVLEFQYSDGYAPRTIRDGKICDNNFADNMVWIPFTVCSIVKELGDASVLDEKVAYNDGTCGTIYEHTKKAVEFLYNFRGNHNLIRIWGGDWNDCMNSAGLAGKGVSVWLSLAWLRANNTLMELAEISGKNEDVEICKARSEEMRELIEKYGWDGEYYLYGYTDDDEKIGSHECEEGKMFLNTQLWAVLSGISKGKREITAMDSAEKYLSSDLGTVISKPPYTKYNPKIGVITSKPAGVHENGGVYLHTIAWKIAVDALLKRAENVEKDIETILPFRNKIVDGRAEPYVMCNSYFGIQTGYRYGTPGQSWRTAAGQWLEKALINYVFGLMPEMNGLTVSPCLPPSWKNASIKKKFRDAEYEIFYENNGTEIDKITVDGKEIKGNLLPYEKGGKYTIKVSTKGT